VNDRVCGVCFSFISSLFFHYPSPFIFVLLGADEATVKCSSCNYNFCARCDFPAHLPASCAAMKRWDAAGGYIETSGEEQETRKLKLELTRPCPKCGAPIEKNGGCPHMTCASW
jgi:hypothetical protein